MDIISLLAEKPIALSLPEYGVWVAESTHGAGFRMGVERHAFHQIYLVQRGEIVVEDGRLREPAVLSTGSLWIIPSGVDHRMEDTAESILLLISLDVGHVQRLAGRRELWRRLIDKPVSPLKPDPLLFSHLLHGLNRIMAEQWQRQPGYEVAIVAEIDQLLVRLCRRSGMTEGNTALERVRRIVSQIEEQFFEEWSIDHAARLAHLSRRRFTALFREATGQTLNTFLAEKRVDHAKALLRGGRHSIAGAALASGIGDVSQFYRLFKKYTGVTPARWKDEALVPPDDTS